MLLNLPHPVPQRLPIPSSVGLHANRARVLAASIVFNMIATAVPLVGQTRGQVVTRSLSQPSLCFNKSRSVVPNCENILQYELMR